MRYWMCGVVMVMAACDEEPLPAGWEVRGSPEVGTSEETTVVEDVPIVTTPCPVADQVFTPRCVECHDGRRFPDLRAGAIGRLAGLASIAYPGETIVVANDADASLLFEKMHAGSGFGALMPPDGALDDAALATLRAWIEDGALACSGVDDPGPVDPPTYEPGGTITFGSAPNGFQTTKPSWS